MKNNKGAIHFDAKTGVILVIAVFAILLLHQYGGNYFNVIPQNPAPGDRVQYAYGFNCYNIVTKTPYTSPENSVYFQISNATGCKNWGYVIEYYNEADPSHIVFTAHGEYMPPVSYGSMYPISGSYPIQYTAVPGKYITRLSYYVDGKLWERGSYQEFTVSSGATCTDTSSDLVIANPATNGALEPQAFNIVYKILPGRCGSQTYHTELFLDTKQIDTRDFVITQGQIKDGIAYPLSSLTPGSHALKITLNDGTLTYSRSVGFVVEGQIPTCQSVWDCTSGWSTCQGGTQTRTCTDINKCATPTNQPSLTQACQVQNTCPQTDPPPCPNGQLQGQGLDQYGCQLPQKCVVSNGTICKPEWRDTGFTPCINGTHTLIMVDKNQCGQTPPTVQPQSCTPEPSSCIDPKGANGDWQYDTCPDGSKIKSALCSDGIWAPILHVCSVPKPPICDTISSPVDKLKAGCTIYGFGKDEFIVIGVIVIIIIGAYIVSKNRRRSFR